MDEQQKRDVEAYSRCEMTAIDLRRKYGDATYGDIILWLAELGLPLPRASQAGREEQIAHARGWMFSKGKS
jgi:hypothetical protein